MWRLLLILYRILFIDNDIFVMLLSLDDNIFVILIIFKGVFKLLLFYCYFVIVKIFKLLL